jgi:peroxiredoxin
MQHSLPFTLLSDETKEVIKMFGEWPAWFWVQRVTTWIEPQDPGPG